MTAADMTETTQKPPAQPPAMPPDPAAEMARLRRQYPAIFAPSPLKLWGTRGFWLAVAVYLLALCWHFGLTPARLWSGLDELWTIAATMFPPTAGGHFADLMAALVETLAMAFLGTTIAAVIAAPLGFLAARNIIPGWVLTFSLRRLFDGIRGVDQLIWALVFVRAVGLGPLAGVLALAVSDTGVLAKLFADSVEGADRKQIDGVRATGANPLLVVRMGVLPQVLPVFLSQTLYFFESNTRSAMILGVVGAGGIGLQLAERIKIKQWDQVLFIVIMLVVTVALIDMVSAFLRRRLLGDAPKR